MTDKEFLIWLHARLTDAHGEKPITDYMHKLRAIIKSTDPSKVTPNVATGNNLEDIL
jgi:hypothetical protein